MTSSEFRFPMKLRLTVMFVLALIGSNLIAAPDPSVDFSLAERFSSHLRSVKAEIGGIDAALPHLPGIPLDDIGGWGMQASVIPPSAAPGGRVSIDIDCRWKRAALIDLVAIVPSRNFDASGLDPHFGLPEDFSVHLIDASGDILPPLAIERSTGSHPERRGLPFAYHLAEPVMAAGLRIHVSRLSEPHSKDLTEYTLSFSEIFCFSGGRNVAERAAIRFAGSPRIAATRTQFLVDARTPLGLPEIPSPDWRHIGWTSGGSESADDPAWIEIDLGEVNAFDGIRLFPALRPNLDKMPGFAIPQRFRVEISDTTLPGSYKTVFDHTQKDIENPGHNPVTLRFPPANGRYVRLTATRLWKPFVSYPAFFAMSEFQILSGEENLALGASVTSSSPTAVVPAHGELVWSGKSLTDGHGPAGELVSTRRWLELLQDRLDLITRRHVLVDEARTIRNQWSRTATGALVLLGFLGVTGFVVLPLAFKFREHRRLREMRNRIAGDLHDELGSNLGSIQILANVVKQESPTHRDEISTISRVAAESVNSVRDIVWLLRPQDKDQVNTIEHLREASAILLDHLEWSFEANIPEGDIALNHEERRDFLLFCREALHNITRHARASKVSIRIIRQDSMVLLDIEDNGIGIPVEIISRPRSLGALRDRARRLGGTLEATSPPDGGTHLHLRFPLKKRWNKRGRVRT